MANEGKEVRVAMDGPDIEHDQLIGKIGEFNKEDGERASSAGETRQKIGQFLDSTSMNSKAFAWVRQIMKVNDKADGQNKAMDIIRSLQAALPMVEAHVAGQGTGEMDLDGPQEDGSDEKGLLSDEEMEQQTDEEAAAARAELEDDDPQALEPGDHVEDEDPETAEFNAEVDDAMGDDENVVTPFGQRDGEEAIDFESGDA